MNTLGSKLRFTSFGESHGPAVGGVLDGMPAGLRINPEAIRADMARRRPGSTSGSTARRESDEVEILSGVFEGVTTGAPIAFIIRNTDTRPADYEQMRTTIRPGHADATYLLKYGTARDWRGGGRASARTTAATVAAGAIARMLLTTRGISVAARILSIGTATDSEAMEREIESARREGDTLGGIVECTVDGCPPGLGDPMFGKLQARLAAALMSIPSAKGFEYGGGFAAATLRGSRTLDRPTGFDAAGLHTEANLCGGLLGGISTGERITMRVAFKPIGTLMRNIDTVDTSGRPATLHPRGRHDVCAVPRVLPVVEALVCLTLADALL